LIPETKEILTLCEQRGHEKSEIINAGLLALGRMLHKEQDKLIAFVKEKVKEASTPPAPTE